MIPSSVLGLVVFAAALGPGYVYVRVAELRDPRPGRSALGEAVEMVSLGAGASLLSAGAVLLAGDWLAALDARQLLQGETRFLADHPTRTFLALVALLGLAYGGAYGVAKLVHRGRDPVFSPAGTVWRKAFMTDRPEGHVTLATVELRDGRKVVGVLGAVTSELADNRELQLVHPIAVQASPTSDPLPSEDRFLLIREDEIVYIAGHYHRANQPPGVSPGVSRTAQNSAQQSSTGAPL